MAWSYQVTMEQTGSSSNEYEETQWRYEDELRKQILDTEETNFTLQSELLELQAEIRQLEQELANINEEEEVRSKNLIEDINRIRKISGAVPVNGAGIEVTLQDAEYLPNGENPNDYIVHEEHVQKVVDELFVSQAEAVAINGYRLTHQSYIQCIGPVILVDGQASAAPFTITAIGDGDTLTASLDILGGVKDQLVNEGITVRIQKLPSIELNPYLSESG
ncbi:hypothetical protein BTS2_3067 [Bacillus sp. TS-2]|nr:hypothetical protein BTS2_3067 [Bacillus sp. TS-2]